MDAEHVVLLASGDEGRKQIEKLIENHNRVFLVVAGNDVAQQNFIAPARDAAWDTDPNSLLLWAKDPGVTAAMSAYSAFSITLSGDVADGFNEDEYSYGRAVIAVQMAIAP